MVDASAVDDMVRTVFEGQDVDVDEETKARTGLVRLEIRRVKARVVGDTFIVVAALNNNEFIIIPSLPMPPMTHCNLSNKYFVSFVYPYFLFVLSY